MNTKIHIDGAIQAWICNWEDLISAASPPSPTGGLVLYLDALLRSYQAHTISTMSDGSSFLRKLSLPKFRKSVSLSSSKTIDAEMSEPETTPEQHEAVADERSILPPETQNVLLLHAARQPYQLTENYPVPKLENAHEVLVRAQAIGLNPIDWKAP